MDEDIGRRSLLAGMAAACLGATSTARAADRIVLGARGMADESVAGGAAPAPSLRRAGPRLALVERARAAFERHRGVVGVRHRVVLVDFAAPSWTERLHVVDPSSGASWSTLVAHGSGSDPTRSGWVVRTSNDDGSNASCEGAFLVGAVYEGRHGASRRLVGLDPTNDNALRRAIVVHGAPYAERRVASDTGALGRSQGCFAVGSSAIAEVLARIGEGTMIYASRA